VRNHLHGAPQVLPLALLGQDRLVDPAGGQVVDLREIGVGETLVVAKIQIALGAIVEDEDLAVLIGTHGARIDIQIGIEFLQDDLQTPRLEQGTQRGRGDPLAQSRNHTTGNEHEFRHASVVPFRTGASALAVRLIGFFLCLPRPQSPHMIQIGGRVHTDRLRRDGHHRDGHAVLEGPQLFESFSLFQRARRQFQKSFQGRPAKAVDPHVTQGDLPAMLASLRTPGESPRHCCSGKVHRPTGAVHQDLDHARITPLLGSAERVGTGGDLERGVRVQGRHQTIAVRRVDEGLVALEVDDDITVVTRQDLTDSITAGGVLTGDLGGKAGGRHCLRNTLVVGGDNHRGRRVHAGGPFSHAHHQRLAGQVGQRLAGKTARAVPRRDDDQDLAHVLTPATWRNPSRKQDGFPDSFREMYSRAWSA